MRMKFVAASAALAAIALTSPAHAQLNFYNACSPGALRICASAQVTVGPANTLLVNVWNMSRPALSPAGRPADLSSYGSETGGWHTITAIGLSNVGYTFPQFRTEANVEARLFDGRNMTLLSKWYGLADASGLQIYNTGADLYDHREGITGCYDPGPASANHVQTCENYSMAPYVQFTMSGFASLDLSNAVFEFQSQQVAYEDCDVSNWNSAACLGNTLAGAGGPTEVVPEPITVLLLGSGLLGVGAAHRRRRRTPST